MAGKGCAEAHARACSPEAPGGAEAVACVLCRGPGPPPVWARRAGRPGRAQVPEPSWPGAPGPRVPRCPPHAPALASGFPRANGNNGATHTPGCSEARSPGSGPRRPRCRLSPVSPPPRLSLLSRDSSLHGRPPSRTVPASRDPQRDHSCKDPASKAGHFCELQAAGLGRTFWGDPVLPALMSPQLLPSSWLPALTLERLSPHRPPRCQLPFAGLRDTPPRSPTCHEHLVLRQKPQTATSWSNCGGTAGGPSRHTGQRGRACAYKADLAAGRAVDASHPGPPGRQLPRPQARPLTASRS